MGVVQYHTRASKNYINENNFILKRSMARIGIDVAQDFIPTPGLSVVMDFAEDMNNSYKNRTLATNLTRIEVTKTTDSYITQVNDECIIKELSEGGYKWID